MGQLGNFRDFMLIARSVDGSDEFHQRIKEAVLLASAHQPGITLRADFDVGPREHVEVFSAPHVSIARAVCDVVNQAPGVRVELAPLKNGW